MRQLVAIVVAGGLAVAVAGCHSDSGGSSAPCDPENLVWVYDRVTDPDDHGYPEKVFRFHDDQTEALTSDDAASGPSLSPDGRQIVFERGVGGDPESSGYDGFQLYVMDSDGSDERPLLAVAPGRDRHPVWSPDGSRIAFVRNVEDPSVHSVMVVPADGGEPRPVPGSTSESGDPAPAWSPDGDRLAWLDRGGADGNATLHWSSVEGGEPGSADVEGAFGPPAWIEGGDAIVVAFHPRDDDDAEDIRLHRIDVASGDKTKLDISMRALGTLPTGELVGLAGGEDRSQIVVIDPLEPEDRQEITTVDGSRVLQEGSVGVESRGPINAVPDTPGGWRSCTP
jgi:dipeptidyl aminopeptidase/acylaminoacyl peptidase